MNAENHIHGSIAWIRCNDCSVEFPTFVFSGDTDMATNSFDTSTDARSKTLFLFERASKPPAGAEVELTRVEETEVRPGEHFQAYLKRAKQHPPKYYYNCIVCSGKNAQVLRNITEEELGAAGYSLVRVGI